MSGEAPRTLSAVRHQMMKGPALACEGSGAPYGRLLLGTGPDMDAVLSVCTAHSTMPVLTTCLWLNICCIKNKLYRGCFPVLGILYEQCTHVDKGRG